MPKPTKMQTEEDRRDQARKALQWLLQRPSDLFTVEELFDIGEFVQAERQSEHPMSIIEADGIIAFAHRVLKSNGGTRLFGTPPWGKT